MKTHESNKHWSASCLIFPLLCFVLGSVAIGVCFRRVWGPYASSSWPVTNGTIIQSAHGSRYYDERSGEWLSKPGCVRYAYVVAGVHYVGDRISFSKSPVDIPPEYGMGRQVSVRYAPGDASTSVLVPGVVNVADRILFVLGVYVLFIGAVVTIAGIVWALRPIRAPQEVALPAGLVIERKRRGMSGVRVPGKDQE